jgi:hypothetical protein
MKPGVKEIRRAFHSGQNPSALLLSRPEQIVLGFILLLRQRNIVPVGKIFNCIKERKVLMFGYKTEDIAPASASEAVVELVFRIYLERRGFFLVEWAQPDVTVARPAQMDRPAYHIDNIHCLLYDGGNTGTSHLASLPVGKRKRLKTIQKRSPFEQHRNSSHLVGPVNFLTRRLEGANKTKQIGLGNRQQSCGLRIQTHCQQAFRLRGFACNWLLTYETHIFR